MPKINLNDIEKNKGDNKDSKREKMNSKKIKKMKKDA